MLMKMVRMFILMVWFKGIPEGVVVLINFVCFLISEVVLCPNGTAHMMIILLIFLNLLVIILTLLSLNIMNLILIFIRWSLMAWLINFHIVIVNLSLLCWSWFMLLINQRSTEVFISLRTHHWWNNRLNLLQILRWR